VVKNVAGYDYGRLHHGAAGSLGVLLSMTLRLIANPPDRRAVWWSCDREELPARLPELRRAWGQDAVAELLVDRVAAVRYALPGPGLVFRQFGPPEELHARMERTGAVDVSGRWPALLVRSLNAAEVCTASSLSVRDPGEDWIADLGNGLLRRAEPVPGSDVASPAALALKRVFDPHGIFPGLPGTEDAR
jgi:FAD/FMN-containing dehydrogenase